MLYDGSDALLLMKHGRRHSSLKEKIYRERHGQGAEGYARPYEAMPMGPKSLLPPPVAPVEDLGTSLAERVSRKTKHALRHAGVDVTDTDA